MVHGRRPREEEIEIWNDFMMKRGWRDRSSTVVAEYRRLRGFQHRDDIQTAFEFHVADESSDDTPTSYAFGVDNRCPLCGQPWVTSDGIAQI